jgi:hypothetical protein
MGGALPKFHFDFVFLLPLFQNFLKVEFETQNASNLKMSTCFWNHGGTEQWTSTKNEAKVAAILI